MGFRRVINRILQIKPPSSHSSTSEEPRRKFIDSGYNSLNQDLENAKDGQTLTHHASAPTIPLKNQEMVVGGPFTYLLEIPGKNTRGMLIDAFNQWLQISEHDLTTIKTVVNVLHTASLLIDDIQDSSILRRGFPSAHLVFGVAQTINSANHAYFLAFAEVRKLDHPLAEQVLTEEMINLHLGQGMDLFWRDSSYCPSEADYLEMVNNKTGGLFRIAARLMQLKSCCSRNYIPLAELLGKIFQIRDDYKNLQSDDYAAKKGSYEDISEGKYSFPIIHSIRTNRGSQRLQAILRQKTDNERVKDVAISCLHATDSLAYTQRVMDDLISQAKTVMHELDDGREIRRHCGDLKPTSKSETITKITAAN